jgi:hypothetical protein
MANSYRNGDNIIIIEDGKNKKKVKITRKISIKVPKNATFYLNTRHSKVKLPKGKTSGKVSYGSFKSDGINGGDLKIYYAPVNVDALNASTLSLNNITDATITSVMNTKLISNSSGLKIGTLNNNVALTSEFGELTVDKINPSFKDFKLSLNHSSASLPLLDIDSDYKLKTTESIFHFPKNQTKDIFRKLLFKMLDNKTSSVNGEITSGKKTSNNIGLTAKFSVIKVK